MKKKMLVFALMLFCANLFAQNKSFFKRVFQRAEYDSNYVVSYYDHFLHITPIALLLNHELELRSKTQNAALVYKPNNAFRFGLGVDYRYLSIEYTQTIDLLDAPAKNKGVTNSFGLRLGVTGRRILATLILQSYDGMYLSNTGDFTPQLGIAAGEYLRRRDIKSDLAFGSLNYFFNHRKYSTMASLWQIDRQKKSAGSLVTGIKASAGVIKSDSSMVPKPIYSDFKDNEKLTESTYYLMGINFGYAHNFVVAKKFFANLMFVPGLNVQFGSYTTASAGRQDYSTRVGYHGDIRGIIGYNGERYYYGIHYSNFLFNNRLDENLSVNSFNTYFRIFLGRRFDLTPMRKRK
jgi:hypothetical protein